MFFVDKNFKYIILGNFCEQKYFTCVGKLIERGYIMAVNFENGFYVEQPGVGIIYTEGMTRPEELTEGPKYKIRERNAIIKMYDKIDKGGDGIDRADIIEAREAQIKELKTILGCLAWFPPVTVAASVKLVRYEKELKQMKEIMAQEQQQQPQQADDASDVSKNLDVKS